MAFTINFMVHVCAYALMTIMTFHASLAASNVQLTIEPMSAITGGKVRFTCTGPPNSDYFFYDYYIKKDGIEALRVRHKCQANQQTGLVPAGKAGKVQTECGKLVYDEDSVSADKKGKYRCAAQVNTRDLDLVYFESDEKTLNVGDVTPDIKKFELLNMADKQTVTDNSKLKAGTNLSITCETHDSNPKPSFTVTISGKETRNNRSITNRVFFYEVVPRVPAVEFRCSVFNGFGDGKEKVINVISEYIATAKDTIVPDTLEFTTDKEITVCSAENNPPQRLEITIDNTLLQEGYPKYTEANGKSEAIVMFAKGVQVSEVEVTCKIAGKEWNVTKKVELTGLSSQRSVNVTGSTGSNSAMTIGIVLAALVLFLLLVAAFAFICKRRDAAKYSKARQNNDEDGRDERMKHMQSTPV